ncbi:hypothetical protein TRVA0_025S00584 [Trichomonascus vanleenenianus]|uniref:Zn(II)2Cys6 transcription factor n=1 Tax=Trichomonascus vanleenenianus TaxID=2268995 RepID=UPI003EC9A63E
MAEQTLKRARVGQACEACRIRKCRCNGERPCSACVAINQECSYIEVQEKRQSKTDQILQALKSLEAKIDGLTGENHTPHTNGKRQREPEREDEDDGLGVALSKSHNSATQNLLDWPAFDAIPMIHTLPTVFELEYRRKPWTSAPAPVDHITEDVEEVLIAAFQQGMNFWYPVISRGMIDKAMKAESSTLKCLKYMVLAVGYACLRTERLNNRSPRDYGDVEIAELYGEGCFSIAIELLPFAFMEDSVASILCIFYASTYMAFHHRPLQEATYLSAATRKCELLLSYEKKAGLSVEDMESIRRVLWAHFILESDISIEINELPQSGMNSIKSIEMPKDFQSHSDSEVGKHASLYFLACISMRRLLNRVHTLLFATEEETYKDSNLIMELDSQLEAWRQVLPKYLKFSLEPGAELDNDHQGFLRQRYFTCKSVIFRPILNHVMLCDLNKVVIDDAELIRMAEMSVEACFLHMKHLQSFTHTVVIDAWICAHAMTAIMIVLFVAACSPSLVPFLYEKLTISDVQEVSTRIEGYLTKWANDCPRNDEPSHSMKQSIYLIRVIRDSLV